MFSQPKAISSLKLKNVDFSGEFSHRNESYLFLRETKVVFFHQAVTKKRTSSPTDNLDISPHLKLNVNAFSKYEGTTLKLLELLASKIREDFGTSGLDGKPPDEATLWEIKSAMRGRAKSLVEIINLTRF